MTEQQIKRLTLLKLTDQKVVSYQPIMVNFFTKLQKFMLTLTWVVAIIMTVMNLQSFNAP